MTSVLGWVGDIALIYGYWQVGNKKRWAHIFTLLGEAAWIGKSLLLGQYDLLIICAIFGIIAVRNWWSWK